MWIWMLGCGSPVSAVAESGAALTRDLADGRAELSCSLPADCPDDRLDAALCIDEALAFKPTYLDDEVVAIDIDDAAVRSLGLAPGEYWAAYNDGKSCDRVVAHFRIGGEP